MFTLSNRTIGLEDISQKVFLEAEQLNICFLGVIWSDKSYNKTNIYYEINLLNFAFIFNCPQNPKENHWIKVFPLTDHLIIHLNPEQKKKTTQRILRMINAKYEHTHTAVSIIKDMWMLNFHSICGKTEKIRYIGLIFIYCWLKRSSLTWILILPIWFLALVMIAISQSTLTFSKQTTKCVLLTLNRSVKLD